MAGERTEKPTQKRLKDAREKGQVPRTREAAQAASLLAPILVLGWYGESFMGRLSGLAAHGFRRAGDMATVPLQPADITGVAHESLGAAGLLVGPLALSVAVLVVCSFLVQGGATLATKAVQVKWEKLSPANGIKRFGLSHGGLELLRMSVAVTLIAVVGWKLVMAYLAASPELARLAPLDAAGRMWDTASTLITYAGIGLIALSGADYLVQRQKTMKQLRMTKQEVRDEMRNMEGSPEIKARVRRIQREMTRRRMLSATKEATVVITNPTHYAVALQYRRSGMAAPVVVAKGQDLMALRIRKVAAAHGVPVVENVQLARALYASAEIGDVIPGALFEAVAEVLAYLVRIRQVVL